MSTILADDQIVIGGVFWTQVSRSDAATSRLGAITPV